MITFKDLTNKITLALDEVSGALLGRYIQKARKQDSDKIAHGQELDSDPKIVALKAKRSELYSRKEYTRTGESKHRGAIDKTREKEKSLKQKKDPNYPESVTPKRYRGIERAVKKLQSGKLTDETFISFKEYITEEVEVSSDTYRFSNTKNPSGHGSWIFTRDGIQHSLDFSKHKKDEDWFEHRGTFGAAKTAAKKWARSKGHSYIHVAP